jgi:hypothetical protein
MDVGLTRALVIGLAVLGALLSAGASFLQLRGYLNATRARALNWTGYGFMGASMLVFVLAGLWT